MDQIAQTFGGMDASVVLWIAAGLAFLFIFIIFADFVRQRRKHRRLSSSRAAAQGGFWDFLFKPWLSGKAPARRRRK